ncbi:MAG: YbgC/FadM family acyl-CoA thioesterase [Alphaproteobacteria bacterium]
MTAPLPRSHECPIRVYIPDTDYGNVVHHPTFLIYAERARTEMLRDVGIHQSSLKKDHGFMFVVSKAELVYKASARLDDLLMVSTVVDEYSKVRMRFTQIIKRDDLILAEVKVEVAAISEAGKPARMPQSFLDSLAHYLPR